MDIFKNLGLDVEIVNRIDENENKDISTKIIKKIKNINIDALTPVKALNILNEFKDMLNNEWFRIVDNI